MNELIYTLDEIADAASFILNNTTSKTILLYAEMGVGKTTLIKELARQLNSDDTVSSPTFSLVNEYASPEGPIFHFDLYRIEEEEEVMDIGFEEYIDQDAWIFIEWPEKIPNLLPEEAQVIRLKRSGSHNTLRMTEIPSQ